MMMEGQFKFATGQALTGTADVVSTNVYYEGKLPDGITDRTSKLFEGTATPVKLVVTVSASGGTTPTLRARLVGADDATLATNPVIIADTGVSVASYPVPSIFTLYPSGQTTAKAYYGVIFTQSGTSPTATVTAGIAETAQSVVK